MQAALLNHRSYADANGYNYIFDDHYYPPVDVLCKSPMYIGCNMKPFVIRRFFDSNPIDPDQFLLWVDTDSYFCSFSPLPFLSTVNDITFTGDFSDIANTGHLLLRNTLTSRRLIDSWIRSMSIRFDPDTAPFPLTPQHYALGDQSLFSAILGAGLSASCPDDLVSGFKQTNGFWRDMSAQCHFSRKIAPMSRRSCFNAAQMVHPTLSTSITILPQRALNSYLYGPFAGHFRNGDLLVHLVSGSKQYLPSTSQLHITGLLHIPTYLLIVSTIKSLAWSFKSLSKALLLRLLSW